MGGINFILFERYCFFLPRGIGKLYFGDYFYLQVLVKARKL